ncbi:MAG: DNA mismatch repair endonuclease MutL, partial [Magnetococcales bacterium]|nr:DNA mismatch repair endonuclease MutL [Magnetococcales bacterium]
MSATRPEIRLLPKVLANQIAAGEVVERPASVVKELLENSLDAGASRVEVCLEGGGRELIQVADNGWGMTPPQARLCLERHATSKITSQEDLFSIATFGFRGEALPSIASVSHFDLESRVESEAAGIGLHLRGGEPVSEEAVVMPVGTRVSVRHLFFNTPARLKFMRSERTENSHVQELLHRFALSAPYLALRLVINRREVFAVEAVPEGGSMAPRLGAVFGGEFPGNCLELGADEGEVTVHGWVGLPTLNQVSSGNIHLFVNGRWIRDRILFQAIRESFRDLLAKDRYPMAALFLQLNPEMVDVNVHPTKQEVRFRNQHQIFAVVRRALSDCLQGMGHRTYQPGSSQEEAEPEERAAPEAVSAVLPARASAPVEWQPPAASGRREYSRPVTGVSEPLTPYRTSGGSSKGLWQESAPE